MINRFIVENTPVYTGAFSVMPYDQSLYNRLSFKDRFSEEDETIFLCKESKGYDDKRLLNIPRALCNDLGEDLRHEGIDISFNMVSFKLREHQIPLSEQCFNLIKKGESFIFQAGTGSGKTIIAIDCIQKYGKKTLVLVDQTNILNQWVERIKQFTDIPHDRIGIIQGDKIEYEDCDIVLGMIHSLCKEDRYPKEVYDDFGLVIADECHVVPANSFQQVMWKLPAKVRMGLTATPDRSDGKSKILYAHIGQIKVKYDSTPLTPKIILRKSTWKCPVVGYDKKTGRPIQLHHTVGKIGHILKTLVSNQDRNYLILDFVTKAYEANRNIVIFSELKDAFIIRFKKLLIENHIPEEDIGVYVGGMKKNDLQIASKKKIVLTTYRMTAKAVDCPWWDTAVLATPRADIRQICGRVLRQHENKCCATHLEEGKKVPLIFDVVDDDSKVLEKYYQSRLKQYRKMDAPINSDI